jgi:hypothetical protein
MVALLERQPPPSHQNLRNQGKSPLSGCCNRFWTTSGPKSSVATWKRIVRDRPYGGVREFPGGDAVTAEAESVPLPALDRRVSVRWDE